MSNNIKQLRQTAGLTQMQLAEKSGVPHRTIQNWEIGKRLPRDVYQLHKIAVALGVYIDDLIVWSE